MKETPRLNGHAEILREEGSSSAQLQRLHTGIPAINIITPLENDKEHDIYHLKGFEPIIIDEAFLRSIGIDAEVDPEALERLIEGSKQFEMLFRKRTLTPDLQYALGVVDLDSELEVHNYTGMCPTYVQELNPSIGACSVACQYCLVTDGDHRTPTTVWENYPKLIEKVLEEQKDVSSFYYFSPKTEAFAEPHLETGVSHGILRAFVDHFEKYPDSKARMFIATKAGPNHLEFKHAGDSIIELLSQLKGKVQINGSIGIMPPSLRDVLESNAPSIEDRLKALQMCQDQGLYAHSVLAQPLFLPYMTEEVLNDFFDQLNNAGIINIKPEFLTVDPMNLAYLAQFVNHFNPELMKEFLEVYIHPNNSAHRKQRLRMAPDKDASIEMLERLKRHTQERDMTISICNWVKKELGVVDSTIKQIDAESTKNGFRCLGYQTDILPGKH